MCSSNSFNNHYIIKNKCYNLGPEAISVSLATIELLKEDNSMSATLIAAIELLLPEDNFTLKCTQLQITTSKILKIGNAI